MGAAINSVDDARGLSNLAISAGQLLLENGAEIYRVEDTIHRMVSACGDIERINVWATYNMILISFSFENQDVMAMRRIKSYSTNLSRLVSINQFSRWFVSSDTTVDESYKKLTHVAMGNNFKLFTRMLSAGLGSACFTLLFKGTIQDSIVAVIAVMLEIAAYSWIEKREFPFFISNFSAALIGATISAIFVTLGIAVNLDSIVIGAIMPLLPGVSITNAVRDLMSGDLLSGTLGMMFALLTGISIAIGVGIVLAIYINGGIIWN